MRTLTRTLIVAGTALFTAGLPAAAFADNDHWRDGWRQDRHERFERHRHHHRHHDGRVVVYRAPYPVYAPPPVVYREPYPVYVPEPVYYRPYYRPARPGVTISTPDIFIGF